MLTPNAAALFPAPTFAALDSMARTLLPALVSYAVRSTAVLLTAGIVVALLRRSAAATRHAVWAGAVATVAALPLLSHATPAIDVPVWALRSIAPAVSGTPVRSARQAWEPAVPAGSVGPVTRGATVPAPISIRRPPLRVERPSAPLDLPALFVAVWLLGAASLLMRSAIGTIVVWRRAVAAAPVNEAAWVTVARDTARELSIRRPVTLLMTTAPTIPVTWGVIYPVLLLPIEATSWSPERRRAVLLHELAHIARFDAATQLLGQLVLATTWFNPLAWLAVRRMRVERERACDDVVLRRGTQPSTYATDLLTIVLTSQTEREPGFAALAMARHGELEGRLRFILDQKQRRATPSRRRSMLSVAAAAPFILLVAAIRPSTYAMPGALTAVARQGGSDAIPPNVSPMPRPRSAIRNASPASPSQSPTPLSIPHSTADMQMTASLSATAPAQSIPAPARAVPEASTRCAVQTASAHGGVSAQAGEVASLELEDHDHRVLAIASDGRCITGRIDGWVILSDDERDVTGLGTGAHLTLTDSVDGHIRGVLVSRVLVASPAQGQAGVANKLGHYTLSADNQPMYVIDGFIVNGLPLGSQAHVDMSSGYPMFVTNINSDDIERVQGARGWIVQKDNQADTLGRHVRSDSITMVSDSVGLEFNSVGGVIAYQYFVDGNRRSWTEGDAWFRKSLAELLRETGYNVQSRVAFLRAHGGMPALLDEIRRVRSDVGLRAYFDALLASGNLSPDDVAQAVNVAQSVLTDKSDRDRILTQLRARAQSSQSKGYINVHVF